MRIASIDIGTNTLRLFIGEVKDNELKSLITIREITRLGGIFRNNNLSYDSMSRTLKTIKSFMKIIYEYEVDKIRAAGTKVLRDAVNKKEFIDMVRKECNLNIEVIPWDEEARLTLKGVLFGIKSVNKDLLNGAKGIVFDIGGGSTEFIFTDGELTLSTRSLDLGVVYLTERFIHSDPPFPLEIFNLKEEIRDKLSDIKEYSVNDILLIGTAGTITTLAVMDQNLPSYDRDKINGYILYRKNIENIFNDMKTLTLEERSKIKGLDKGREDIILAGIMITLEVMNTLNADKLIVSDYGLVEGIALDTALL
jgi:exopolyphosphatase/guanosine-5'-triphosphate,3'-diphosphate pyrophosphatase